MGGGYGVVLGLLCPWANLPYPVDGSRLRPNAAVSRQPSFALSSCPPPRCLNRWLKFHLASVLRPSPFPPFLSPFRSPPPASQPLQLVSSRSSFLSSLVVRSRSFRHGFLSLFAAKGIRKRADARAKKRSDEGTLRRSIAKIRTPRKCWEYVLGDVRRGVKFERGWRLAEHLFR